MQTSLHIFVRNLRLLRVLWCQVGFAVASIVSSIALYIKIKVLIHQLRYRRTEIDTFEDDRKNEATSKKHNKRLVKTRRTLLMIYASMMVGCAEVFLHVRMA